MVVAFRRDDLRFLIFVFSPLLAVFRFVFFIFQPLSSIFRFLFSVVLQKCSPLCLAKKMLLSIIKPMVSSIVFFGRSGALLLST